MRILGIESSCDDTAASVVTSGREILSNIVWSQLKQHADYGGVVPEIAARSHVQVMDEVVAQALKEADTDLSEIDLIAVTAGPGLIGGVMVGVMTAKALSLAANIPIVAVNHLAGHALTVRLTDGIDYSYLLLLISGGHCQWLEVTACDQYRLLGQTMDDALGEAFDKTAKMLGLGYPGGPVVEKLAALGDKNRFDLPVPLKGTKHCDFSFSGLKTAVRETILKEKLSSEQDKADLCASFQYVVGQTIADRLGKAIERYEGDKQLVVAGGVAANQYLREIIEKAANAHEFSLFTPPVTLCTDNGTMIAWSGYEQYCAHGATPIGFEPRARWALA